MNKKSRTLGGLIVLFGCFNFTVFYCCTHDKCKSVPTQKPAKLHVGTIVKSYFNASWVSKNKHKIEK